VKLILLNGPPACGKSTLAARYAAENPFALNLDIDRLRSLIGRWRDDPPRAGLLARSAAIAMARVHLSAGHDVVVPQFLARPGFAERLELLAQESGADFHEVVLLENKENVLRRFAARDPSTVDIRRVGPDELEAMYDRFLGYVAGRERARAIRTNEGDVDGSYRDFLGTLTE
jgi:predicted kinase